MFNKFGFNVPKEDWVDLFKLVDNDKDCKNIKLLNLKF